MGKQYRITDYEGTKQVQAFSKHLLYKMWCIFGLYGVFLSALLNSDGLKSALKCNLYDMGQIFSAELFKSNVSNNQWGILFI